MSSHNSPKTPEKGDQRPDGHFATPQKRRLDFDYFNQGSSKRICKGEKDCATLSISDLTIGEMINAIIMLRISYKSQKRHTKSPVFNFLGLDGTGEISVVGFREAVDKYYDMILINSVIKVQNFSVKEESKEYPSGSGNAYQIVLNLESLITQLGDEGRDNFPAIPFHFISVRDAKKLDITSKADLLGVIGESWVPEKTKKGTWKRDLAIVDQSMVTIILTLWGTAAENFDSKEGTVVAVRKASVSEYQGIKSLNAFHDTLIWPDPAIESAPELHDWFANLNTDEMDDA